ncbi:MAG TPA: DUF2953 domain-containing protein [Bacillota bacterium]|nr:DUF2953 domain-containing protein [Bacillota bacterium]
MIVIYVLLWLLLALLLLVLLVLTLAVDYSVRARAEDDELEFAARLSWAGLLKASYTLDDKLRVKLAGFTIKADGVTSSWKKKADVRSEPEVEKKVAKKKSRRSGFPLGIRQAIGLAKDLLRYLRPRTLQADLKVGFDDPYHTGLMMAFVYTALGHVSSVKITPVFDEAVLSGSFLMEGRVRPVALVFIALRTFGPVFLGNIKRKFTRKREETQNAGI